METLMKMMEDIHPHNYKIGTEEPLCLKFRATSALFLNDSSENQLIPQALDILGVSVDKIMSIQNIAGQAYVVSFCKECDSLTMWRLYGNNGQGINIGINEEQLKQFYTEKQRNVNICVFGCCQYTNTSELAEIIRKSDAWKQYESNPNNLIPLLAIYNQSLLYKHEAFQDENEFRIGIYEYADEEFIYKNNQVVPYQELLIPLDCIQTITIGPCQDIDKAKYSIWRMRKKNLEGYLHKYHFGEPTLIWKSEAPYVN